MEICYIEDEPMYETDLEEVLLACLNKLSNPSNECESHGYFSIDLSQVHFTPIVLSLLVQLMNQPLPKTPTDNHTESKWDEVVLVNCFLETMTTLTHLLQTSGTANGGHCTREDLRSLLAPLTRRTKKLFFHNCPQLSAALTRIPDLDHLEVNHLYMHEHVSSVIFDYGRLGEMIQRSTHLTKLNLSLPFEDFPRETFESLSNAFNLQELHLSLWYKESYEGLEQILSDLVGDEASNGAVVRLLQNPQSQLQHLDSRRMRLDDRHFTAIARALPTSRLKFLNVSHNNIQSAGILEFARQLPRIESLRTIVLLPNPWLSHGQSSVQSDECGAALVQGMMENCSIDHVTYDNDTDLLTVEEYPNLVMHLADLNRAGRRILSVSRSVPLGLWAHVLERAGRRIVYPVLETRAIPPRFLEGLREAVEQPARRANAVFFLLQNSPIFCDQLWDRIQRNRWK